MRKTGQNDLQIQSKNRITDCSYRYQNNYAAAADIYGTFDGYA